MTEHLETSKDVDNKLKYDKLKEKSWSNFVFAKKPDPEVGYGRLACECPNLGAFIESFTADLGDYEAERVDLEEEERERLENLTSEDEEEESNNEEDQKEEENGTKRKLEHISPKFRKRSKPEITDARIKEQDEIWAKRFVERPGNRIYQLPHLQIQTVCMGGLTNLRQTLLREFQLAANIFQYSEKIYSKSPVKLIEDFVSSIPHQLTNELDPIAWEHYRPPVYEALCVLWENCPLEKFNLIPCGHGPGETFQGKVTQTCQESLNQISINWRKQLSMITKEMQQNNTFIKLDGIVSILKATYPLKLVYVNKMGRICYAKKLEECRLILHREDLFPTTNTTTVIKIDYPKNSDVDCASDYEDEDEDEDEENKTIKNTHLDIFHPPSLPELDILYPNWKEYISDGCEVKLSKYDSLSQCSLCPHNKSILQDFRNVQDFVTFKSTHLCNEHEALGANVLLEKLSEWIEYFSCQMAKVNNNSIGIFETLLQAGYHECGYYEQGIWQVIPWCTVMFNHAKQKKKLENNDE
jgi:hypothetical protein